MSIENGTVLKVVQHITMPDAVDHINTYFFNCDFAATQTDQQVINNLESWIEALYTTIDDLLSDELSMGEMEVYERDTVLGRWDLIGSAYPTVTLAATSEMLPHGVCALVRAYTVNPRVISRKYLGGLTEGAQEDGVWNSAAVTALTAFGNAWDDVETITANNDLVPAVWSTVTLGALDLNGVEVVPTVPAYQRRRRPGVGS